MKQKISYLVLGLFVGLVVGFMVTNYLNRPEFAVGKQTAAAQAGGGGGMPSTGPGTVNDEADPHGGGQQISDEELQHIKQQVDAHPEKYDDQLMLAEYLLRVRHEPKDAIAYYERASQLKPDELKPIVGLGDANFDAASPQDGDESNFDSAMLKKAGDYYEKALAIDPKNVNVRTDMGLTYFYRQPRDVDRAIAEYRKSLAVDPKHEITLQNLVSALTVKGDYAGAEQALAQLQAVSPNNPAVPRLKENIDSARSGQNIPTH